VVHLEPTSWGAVQQVEGRGVVARFASDLPVPVLGLIEPVGLVVGTGVLEPAVRDRRIQACQRSRPQTQHVIDPPAVTGL
jgi:hypothetical protein